MLLTDVGPGSSAAGGLVAFAGQDPIVTARHWLGAASGCAVGAAGLWRHGTGSGKDLQHTLAPPVRFSATPAR